MEALSSATHGLTPQPPLCLLCVCLCLPGFQLLNDVLTRYQLHMQIGEEATLRDCYLVVNLLKSRQF